MDEIELIYSQHCQAVSSGATTVRLQIYRGDEDGWILEVVDEHGNSTVWDDLFATDEDAFREFNETLAEEGIEALIGPPGSIDTNEA